MKNLSYLLFLAAGLSSRAFATTCTPTDWIPGFCDLPIATTPRCALGVNNWVARGACVAATAGCAEIGGCFGNTPIGHWWPVNEDGADKRCQCGCFAEETEFGTDIGSITGTELISRSSEQGIRLQTLDSFESKTTSSRVINGIVFGPEKPDVYEIATDSDRTVTLSSEHPVLIVDQDGQMKSVKAASKLEVGDLLLSDQGQIEQVQNISRKKYSGRMINFNVASTDANHHFIPANGIVLGDNAWQQRLASVDARILLRADLIKELAKQGVK